MTTKEQVIEILETIVDPELHIDIWTMGLIYGIDIKSEKEVSIRMTFTTLACPYGPMLKTDVVNRLRSMGFDKTDVEITFDPPWKPSQQLRDALGIP